MEKLHSFEEFSKVRNEQAETRLREEVEAKRNTSAETFKSILAEYEVASVEELTEEQMVEFFTRLKASGIKNVTESVVTVNEGTRSFFGKIDKKGDVEAVYMHYDGYPENMLPLIKKGYSGSKTKNVDVVIKNGDGSGLEADPKKINYYKDSQEPLTGNAGAPREFIGKTKESGAEFIYLYDERDGKWYMADTYKNDNFVPAFESATVEEGLSRSDLSRMGGLVNRMSLKSFFDAAHSVAADLYEDGFEEDDIEEYLIHLIKQEDWSVNEDRSEEIEDTVVKMGEVEVLEDPINEEAEINSDEEFKEYAFTVLKKAFGEEFDETKAQEVVDGILGKTEGDYGVAIGMLTKSLG